MSIELASGRARRAPRPAALMTELCRYAFVGFFSLVVGYPVVWMVMHSLKNKFEMYANVWGLPRQIYWQNYVQAWRIARMGNYIANSVIVSVGTVLLVLATASLAAYAFSKFRFRGH